MTATASEPDVSAAARRVADIARAEAAEVDAQAGFPHRAMDALRESGLLGLTVPRRFGGMGAGLDSLVDVAGELAGACLSTAMIWAMHIQQVAVLTSSAPQLCERLLPRIAAGEVYLASVTSERSKGGHLLSATQPLHTTSRGYHLERDAPIVTGAKVADGFLITMRSAPEAPSSSVTLLYADRSQVEVETRGAWDPLGMRGTESLAARITGDIPADQVIGRPGEFRRIATHPFITTGHIGWAACWLGAARSAFHHVVAILRDPDQRKSFPLGDDLFGLRLARIRLLLDTASAFLRGVVREVSELDAQGADPEQAAFQLHVNGLKVVVSEQAFTAVDQLIELVGLRLGYLRGGPLALERCFRDLRSASLNYGNDRLLVANGWLSVLDREVRLLGTPFPSSTRRSPS